MKYSKEQRLQIGKEIYTRRINTYEAAKKYDINFYTARDYMRLYRYENKLCPANRSPKNYEDLNQMSKEQLINEVIKARNEARVAKNKLLALKIED